MPNIPCSLVLKQCLPCNDDPIRNITAEAPDVDVFVGFRDFKWNPPLGVTYFQLACKSFCFSEVSQQEADLCALREAEACVWNGGSDPISPPVPPGPDDHGGKGGGTNLPPTNPRTPVRRFGNSVQTCDALCPDGSPFTESVATGTVTELQQALADAKAKSLACKLAQEHLFCVSGTAPAACVGDNYFFLITTNMAEDLIWSIDGDLPLGLNFNFDGTISGIPFVGGSYTFVVEVSDSQGRMQAKVLTICVMEIVTSATLPDAMMGQVYAQPLIQQPATVSSEVWTLVSGSLPSGITLAANGSLTGIPTAIGMSFFTLMVNAVCDGLPVSCQKAFTLEVVSAVDCMGVAESIQDANWSQLQLPGAGTINITGGDATFSGNAANTGIYVEVTAQICNPKPDAYAFTVDFTWTTAGFAFATIQAIVRLNGVDTNGPVENGNGGFSFHFDGMLLSGINTLNVEMTGTGIFAGTVNGTIAIRPLTPP